MLAVAVGGFDERHVGPRGDLAAAQHRVGGAPQVAGEQDGAVRGGDPDRRRAQDVARPVPGRLDPVAQVQRPVELDGAHERQGLGHVADAVQGQGLLVAREPVLVGEVGVPLLQVRRVAQDDLGERLGGVRAPDRAAEPVLDQAGQVAGVVHVGVGEQHVAEGRRIHGEGRPVRAAELLHPLEESAVDQDPARSCARAVRGAAGRVDGEKVLRPGHGACPAEECERRCHGSSVPETMAEDQGCGARLPTKRGGAATRAGHCRRLSALCAQKGAESARRNGAYAREEQCRDTRADQGPPDR